MKHGWRIGIGVVGASAALGAASVVGAEPDALDAQRRADAAPAVQPLLRSVLKTTGAPGGVMVVTDGSRTWQGARGLANLNTRAPMRLDHRFRIASITKTFVATVVLQLVAESRLRLDDPVERWVPGGIAGGDEITIRHLLSHTSGLVSGSAQVPPGAFHYTDGNYILLGSVVAAVTGSTIKGELEQRLIRPLSLRNTLWPLTATAPRLARGYGAGRIDASAFHPALLTPALALVSTAADVRTFLRALLRGRLLAASDVETMKAYGPPAAGESYDAYGLGLIHVSRPCPVWGHRGRVGGYTSYAFADGRGATNRRRPAQHRQPRRVQARSCDAARRDNGLLLDLPERRSQRPIRRC